ncbi:MAG: rubredoxin [Planctomycetota bacterium]
MTDAATITQDDLAGLIAGAADAATASAVQLIDVRPARLFAAAHIPGAINVPFESLADATAASLADAGLDPARDTVVYGRKDEAGRKAAVALAALGFGNLRVLDGGMNLWLRDQRLCDPPVKGWACGVCSYGYQVHRGDDSTGVEPGTLFEELPAGWRCPWCGAMKDRFIKETWT